MVIITCSGIRSFKLSKSWVGNIDLGRNLAQEESEVTQLLIIIIQKKNIIKTKLKKVFFYNGKY